ncbi:MAG: phage virion morphogenesis protein [Proteobacteria bacterium]|nr:phage virion morphogenesis protein [Pseudomonadota bacterium]
MLTITVDDAGLQSYLRQLQSRVTNLTPAMDAIGNLLENRIRQRFQTATDPSGKPWAQWAPSTQARYPSPGTRAAKKYGAGNARLLDRHGTMLGGLNYQADSKSVTVGFAAPYSAYHEFGTKHMPRRGMLLAYPETGTLGPGDQTEVLKMITDWLSPRPGSRP